MSTIGPSDGERASEPRGWVLLVGAHGHLAPAHVKLVAHRNDWEFAMALGLDVAIDLCRERWPDVAIVDVGGLRLHELEPVLTWLRRQARIPVIAVTASEDVESRLLALRLGVDDHAVTPLDPRELEARI